MATSSALKRPAKIRALGSPDSPASARLLGGKQGGKMGGGEGLG